MERTVDKSPYSRSIYIGVRVYRADWLIKHFTMRNIVKYGLDSR
jgi:hypothetical protein